MTETSPITLVLQAAERGDPQAAADLLPLVYEELRRLARSRMARERPGHTLQATALVHEAYLRVLGKEDVGWKSRGHFFGSAARAMRRILVEQARRKQAAKRGGDRRRVDLEEAEPDIEPPPGDVLAVEEALGRLEVADPRKGRIVELRYFVGLTVPETAGALGLSVSTIEQEWRYIRAWLQRELGAGA